MKKEHYRTAGLVLLAATLATVNPLASTYANADERDVTRSNFATALANNVPWISTHTAVQTLHPLAIQTLSVEKQESKNTAAANLLRVYQFHYDLQQARLVVVNPAHAVVVKTQSIDSVHLPLNANEIAYAASQLEQQASIISQLRQEQTKRGRIAFGSLSELDVKASIFEPFDENHECHRQRCALLSLFDDTRTVFSTEPVVNLQSLNISLLVTR